MSANQVQSQSQVAGPGLATLLTVAFVVLKLTGVITWSWFWVLSPLWISVLLFLVIVAVIAGAAVHQAAKK